MRPRRCGRGVAFRLRKGLLPIMAIEPVSGLQHFRTIHADGHFSAHGMPNRARVVPFRVRGLWVEGPHATPGPLPDALGGTRVSSVLGPVTLNPSARDR